MNKKYRTVYNKASKTWTLSLVNEEKQVSSRMNGKRFVFNAIASGLMIASGQAFAANGAVTTDDVSTRAAGTDNVCYFDSQTNAVICGSKASASSTGSVAIGTNAKAGGRTKPNTQTVDTADVNNIAIGQGAVASAQNPIEAIGSGNIAIGKNVKAVGNSSLAMGNSTGNYGGPQTYAAGADSYAIGNGARTGTTVNSASQVTGKQSTIEATPALGAIAFGSDSWVKDEGRYGIAIGDNAYVGLDNGVKKTDNDEVNGGVAIGRRARVTKKYATAMGSYAQATGAQSIAIGGSSSETYAAKASGISSIALGEVTRSEGARSVAIAKEANATATDSIAMGTQSKATAVNALAIGTNSEASAQNASAFGVRALANQSAATALGANTQATGVNAVAVGSDALSTAESGIAIGKGAKVQHTVLAQATNALNKAQKDYDDAKKAGGSSPNDEQKTAIATAKTALDTAKTNYTTAATTAAGLSKNSIAIGKDAQVEGMQSISIGTGNKVTGNNAGAYGDPSEVRGNNSYTFGNDNIVNTETSGAFILGNQNGMGTLGKYDDNGKLTLGSGTDTKNASNSVSLGNRNHITTEDTFVLGSGINTKGTGSSLTSIGSTVANSVYLGKDSSANGNDNADATKYQTLPDSDKQGTTTTGGMAKVDKATVNGISYGGFAGNTPIGVVTVGYSGGERRIQNVAAGEISETSTDAINGSQLYLITEGLSKQISGNTTALGGNAAYNPETKVYTAPTYNLYTGTSTPNTTGSNTQQPASTSHTVGDAITALNNYVNNGFNVKDNGGNTQGVVTPGESVQFINGTGTTSTVTTEANSVTKIQYDVVKSGLTANPSNGTVTATDKGDAFATAGDIATAINNSGFIATASGNQTGAKEQLIKAGEKVTLDAGKNLTVVQKDGKFSFATADNVNFNNVNTHTLSVGNSQTTPVVNMTTAVAVPASNNATEPATALDIKSSDGKPTQITGVGSTLNKEDVAINPMTNGASNPVNTQLVNLTENSVNPNSAATVGDLQNMGWLVSAIEGNGYKDVVKNANQVDFKGTGLATVKGETVDNIRTITVDVNAQAVSNKSQLPVVYTKADGTKVVKDPVSGNFYVANADGTPDTKQQVAVGDVITSMNNGDNSTTAPTTLANVKGSLKPTYNVGDMTIDQDGKPTQVAATAPTKSETLAPADAAKVYNHAATVGDVLNAGWNLQNNGDAKDFVKPYDTVNFVNGTGTTAVVTTSADGKTSEIRIDSPMGYVGTDGKTVDANGKPNTATNSVSLVGKDDTKPVALKNVSSGLVDNSTGDAVKLADAAGTTLTNAVNVGDLKQAAAAATTKVDGDSGVSVTPQTNADGSTTYTVAAKTDGVTTEVVDGNIVAKTSSLTINDETGKVNTPNSPTSLATAGDIATAINNSGFTLTAQGENGSLVKPGSTVDMKNTDGNILISKQKDSNDVTYNLSKDIKVNSVTAGNTKVSNDGVTINNGAAGQPVTLSANGLDNGGNKITNVAAGQADTDAVNVSQLNGAVAGSKENVTSSNKTVNIAETTDPTTGAKTFDLAVNTGSSLKTDPTTGKIDVNTDGNTIKQDPTTGALQVATTTITPNANGSVNAGDKTSLATAETVANAINQSGFNLTTSASEGTVSGSTNELVNPSETITLDAGKNIAVTQKGNTISVATKDEVAFKSVTVPTTNSNVVINKDGINAGNTKVTGVASGTNVAVTNVNAPTDAEKTNIANAVKNATGNMLTNAANIGDLQAVAQNVNGSVNNIINNVNNIHNILGGTVFTTYNVADNQTYTTNSVKSAIDRMNAEGIKYFHVNNEKAGTDFKHDGKTTHDSNAKGAYATAIGYDANAQGTSSIAIGHGAEATGTQSISIGTGNKVAGNHSGAFGDPNIINGTTLDGTKVVDGSYAFGNNNIINSANTFVLGNNVNNKGLDTSNNPTAMGSTVENSIYLGNQTTATADAGYNLTTSGESGSTTTGGATGTVNSATVSGVTYGGFAGATANGVVSVGASGSERRIQNVAAGEISATSTDAINGSQLYQTTSKVINSLPLQYSNVNAPVQSNGGSPTNHVTLVGANEQAPVTLHNVAEGVAPTDAVNVNQLYKLNNNLHYKMQNIADEADAGTASAMAAAGLPQAYLPGKSMVAVSGSTYRGKQGYAIGMSAISDGGNWVIKGVATGNSKGHFGATIGAGYQW